MTKPQNANIKPDDIVLVNIDVYGDGKINTFDGHVSCTNDKGVDVTYLQGHHSRNDFVEWDNVIARYDESAEYVSIGGFVGKFEVFE